MLTKTLKLLVYLGIVFISFKSYAQPAFTIQNVKGDCEGSSTGSLEVLVTAANGPVEIYVIAPLIGPFPATVGVPVAITGLAGASGAGRTYIVAVSDDDGPSSANVQILSYPNALTGNIAGVTDNSDCVVSNGAIDITPSGGSGVYTYRWVEMSDPTTTIATTQDVTGLLGGNYRVTIGDINSNCTEDLPIITVNNPSPASFDLTSPTLPVCTGTDLILDLDGSEPGVTYEVYRNNLIPTGIIQTGTGGPLNFIVPFGSFANGNNFKIFATNGICEGDMDGVIIAVIAPLPTLSGVVVGSVCAGGISTNLNFTGATGSPDQYSIDFDLAAQGQGFADVVNLNLPAAPGSIGITVPTGAAPGNYNAILTVRNSTTGCSSTQIPITISVIGLPVPTIAGPNDVCVNSTGNVYTTQPGMSNYLWTVTGGTVTAGGGASNNTVTVTWPTAAPGSVSVNYTQNTCPATAPVVYPVNVKPLAVPTIVSGPNDVCLNTTGNVYTTQAAKTNYVWTVSGGTITAGGTATDNTATVTWTTVGARNISVNYAESGCPAATPFIYAVNVKPLPTPTIASGPNDVCINSTGNVYTTQAGKTNYVWTVVGGTITAGGTPTDNTATVTWNTAGAQSVSINYTENGCAATTPTLYPVNVKPLPVPTIVSGPNDVCVNATGNVYTTQAGMSSYVWTVSAGGTITAGGGATNNTVTVTWTTAGARSVSVNYTQNGCNTPTAGTYAVNVKPLAIPTVASGPNDVCVNSTGNVYTTQAGKTNYIWSVSTGGTITAGGTPTDNTVTVTWTAAGARSVSINYSENGCAAATPATYAVNVKALPTPTIASGPNDVCINSIGNVYTTQAGKSNYVWTVAGGTITAGGTATDNTVTVTWTTAGSQSVSINYTENGCTAGAAVTYPVNVKPLPVPTIVSGPNDVCVNSTGNVYTTQAGKTNYVWTVSAGGTITAGGGATNNTVTVTWATAGARSVSVNYTENGCTVATPATYAVNVKALPTPTVAGGPNDVCVNSTGNVYTTQAGKSNYAWTVSSGGTITAGGTPTDNTVTVTWTMAGARTVSINYTENGCAAGAPSVYAVNVKALAAPTIASGPNDICVNSTGNVYTTQAGKTNYLWTVSPGGTITSGGTTTDNTVTITWTTAGPQTVGINYTENGCTAAAATTYPVNVKTLPTPTITSGPNDVCVNSTGNVYATQPGMSNYLWTVSAGGTITAGGGPTNNTVTITWNTVGPKTVGVNYTENGCSTGVPATFAVNVDVTPSVSGAALDPVCEGGVTTNLTYTGALGSPNEYTIDFDGIAQTAGLLDIVDAAFTASPIAITIPGTVGAGTYNGTITVSNTTTGCASVTSPISLTVAPGPTMTGIIVESACAGSTSTNLHYGATTGTPTQFSLDFDDASFTDVVNAALTPTPLVIPIPVAAAPGNYTATLTVANGTGCSSAGIPITISIIGLPVPAITSGPADVCVGATNIYTTQPGKTGYVWTVSSGGTITAGAGTNSITVEWTGTGSQTLTVNYTENTCAAATPGSLTVNVNETPTISGVNIDPVCSGTDASLTYSGVTGTPDEYSIDFNGIAETAGLADVTASLPISPITILIPGTVVPGTYNANLTVQNSATGCASAVTPISITVRPSPTATITGSSSICSGSPATITLNFTGTTPWTFEYSDGTTTFPAVTWPSSSISFSPALTATTTYTIVSISDGSGCTGTPGASLMVTVNQNPQVNLPVGATPDPLCSGGVADVTVDNSELGVSYQLRNAIGNTPIGAPVVGTGGTIVLPTGALLSTQTFNVLATATGCTPVQLTNTVTVNVSGAVNPSLAVTAVANPICEGSSAIIQVISSENGVLYQLRDDLNNDPIGAAVAGTGATIDLPAGVLAATTSFNVLATNGLCSIELTDIETVTVNVNPDPSLVIAVTLDPICVGGSSVVTVAGSETGVSYQLRTEPGNFNVGVAVLGNGGVINLPTGALTVTGSFNVLATSGVCTAVELATTATVNVSGTIDMSLAVTAVPATVCAGTGTDIEITNSENGVTYQLRNDADDSPVGAAVAGNGATIALPTGNLSATTTFNVLADNGTCSIELSDLETVNVDPAPNAALTVGATLNPLCTGGSSAVRVLLSQLGVNYQLRNDAGDVNIGPAVAGTGATIILPTGPLATTTTFNVLATSGTCTSVELTQLATITVTGTLDATLNVASSASPICEGSSTFIRVLLSETGVNYQLRNDADDTNVGPVVAGNGGTINLPTGNISVTTTYNVVASNGTCSIELTDTETVNVNPSPDITLAVAPSSGLICSGTSTSIVVTGSESGVSYQLRNNAGNANIGSAVAGTGGNISLPTGNLTVSTTFNVFAILGSCSAQLTATASVAIRPVGDPACGGGGPSDCANFSAIIPTIVTQPSCNDRDAGEVSFTISRSDATSTTFRVIWSYNGTDQTKFTSNTVSFDDLSSGLYQYTIIDEGNGRSCGPVDFFLDLKTQVEIQDKEVIANVTCTDGTDGNVILKVDGTTTGEYWYKYVVDGQESVAQTFTPGAPLPGGLPADDDDFIIIKVDQTFAFACPDTVMVRIRHIYPRIDFAVASTEVSTCNGTDGTIQVTAIGGGNISTSALQIRLKKEVPLSTDPSGYMVVADFEDVSGAEKEYSDLAQGNYIIDVKDESDCIQSKPIAIQAPGQVPLAVVDIIATDAGCANEGSSGTIQVAINAPGIYEVAVSQDQVNVPDDDQFVAYNSPSLPSITFNNLARGRYFLYIKSSTTECPTRSDVISIGGVYAISDFDIISNCENVNLTLNNITGQDDAPFTIRVFKNTDKFFKIDSLTASAIPQSKSVSFVYSAPLTHKFLTEEGTYRFVMIQSQTTGAGTCTLVSDTVVYDVSDQVGIVLGQVKPSFPDPKRTGSIEIENVIGGQRFVSGTNELYYEVSLTTADDDIIVFDWTQLKLNPQNKFSMIFDYLSPGVYRVKVRDASGCIKTQDVEISLDPSVYVPNIFTPNDDAMNDEFEVLNLPLDGKHKLIVSNRWGNEVYTSNDYREGNFWNAEGTSDGIYFYRLQVEGGGTYSGWVEILRGNKP